MIAPIGYIKICVPGNTNLVLAFTSIVADAEAEEPVSVDVDLSAKTPETKVASLEERVVLTVEPVDCLPVRVTVGINSDWRAELQRGD